MPSIAIAQVFKAPPSPGLYNWSGPYVGVEGGYGVGNSTQTDPGLPPAPPPPPPIVVITSADGAYRVAGAFIGGSAGYNWQIARWVFGIEGDYSWSGIKGSLATCGTGPSHPCGTSLDSFGTLRARVGHTFGMGGDWLPYVTGGLVVGDVHAWDSLTPASGNKFRAGWTAGAGIEKALARNWTVKLEYLYINLGSAQYFNVVPGVPETVSFRANLIRLGFNFRF